MKRHDLRILLLILTCLLAACAAVPTPSPTLPPPTSSPTRPPASTSTPRPTATLTATTEPTADLALAREKWLMPVGIGLSGISACSNALKVIEKYQANELPENNLVMELSKAMWSLGVGVHWLKRWAPPPELIGARDRLYDSMAHIAQANGHFLDTKDAPAYLATLDEHCLTINQASNEVMSLAHADGLAIQDILDLFQRFLQLPLDTSTPTPDVQHP